MRLSRLIVASALTVMTTAQLRCDPLTQYVHNSQCCKMCGPGFTTGGLPDSLSGEEQAELNSSKLTTVSSLDHPISTCMSSLGTCLEPQCQPCGRNEYQDKYTRESNCQRQPYCDPNLNFQVPVYESTKRCICICKVGFHCSTEECIICVQHRTCQPGHGAQSRGNHSHDTVCQKCPEGTYSEENSWDGVCKEWTECEEEKHIQQSGTAISDSVCMDISRTHVVVIVVVLLLVLPGLVAALMCWQCRGRDAKGKVKACVDSCLGEKRPWREATVQITNPIDGIEEEFRSAAALPVQEEDFTRTTVENEDEPSGETSTTDALLSERGNLVAQENGKAEILSQQESLTHMVTD